MRVVSVLRRRPVAILWAGQVLSALGDCLYLIALMWVAVRVAGSRAGLVAAAQSTATLAFATLGGVYADRWDRRRTMIAADLARAALVATLPLAATLAHHGGAPIGLAHLVAVGVGLGALDALFRPALQASLPALVEDRADLQATNALMDGTARIARALGPALAGLLAAHVSLVHFFTVDALSFLASAAALVALGSRFSWRGSPAATPHGPRGLQGIARDVLGACRLVRAHRPLAWAFATLLVTNAAWTAMFIVGAPLFTQRVLAGDVGTYGLIVSAYGAGNVAGNLVFGSLVVERRALTFFGGNVVFGAGFLLLAAAPSLPLAMLGAAIAAVGAPMGDLQVLSFIQNDLPADQMGKVISLRMVIEYGGGTLGLALAAPLYAALSTRVGIASMAAATVLAGAAGLARFGLGERAAPLRPAS